jgi:colanic acid biosynthesis glycosyl transferase WcaI
MVKSSMPQKWLILSQYYPPEIGAPQIRLQNIALELARRGFQVEVLTGMPNYPAGKIFNGYSDRLTMSEVINGIKVRRVWLFAGTGKSAWVRLANYLSFTFCSIFLALFGPRPDVMFVESQPLSLGVAAILMKVFRGVPYIYNVPDLQIDVAKQMGFMKNEAFLKIALNTENYFLKQSWKVSTVTHRFIDHFVSRRIPRQITFLPNGADVSFLKPQTPALHLVERWNLLGKKVFVYVGTHAFYHGLDTLIKAADIVRDRQDIAFLLIGDGPERKRLINMAKELDLSNVVFGNSPYEEMSELYSIAYASVATLRNISVAKDMRLSKIFPSMSCGVPVIYSGSGEAAELLDEKNCGVSVEPENENALATAILEMADSQEMRDQMGKNGRILVEKEYSWSTTVEKWLKELE